MNIMGNFRFIILSALLMLPFVAYSWHGKICVIEITNTKGKKITVVAELALSSYDQQRGLMHRKDLPDGHGMLFVFPSEDYRNFWMKNTSIPLSIAYISEKGIINEIYDMKPLDISKTYPSVMPAAYALEVNQGWFKKNNISRGCRVDLNGCVSQQNSFISGRKSIASGGAP